MQGFWDNFAPMQEKLWGELGSPVPDAALQARVTEAVEGCYGDRSVLALAKERDIRLRRVLAARDDGQ